jgi:uncharacterized small protein (DUF1192 family)
MPNATKVKSDKIKKQPWDESINDTPEYDIRKMDGKIAKAKAEIAKLQAEYQAKFSIEFKTK